MKIRILQRKRAMRNALFVMLLGVAGLMKMHAQNITFVDANVKAICVENWDTDGDGELSYSEAAAVMDLGLVFEGNTGITSFDELQYFTGLTSIGNWAFEYCNNLALIEIPNSVTSIGYAAFSGCSSLTSIEIPNSVTTIEDWAFCYCQGLTSVVIPSAVTSIGNSVYYGCSGLEQIVVNPENTVYDSRGNSNAIIETCTNTLIAGCKNTVIPNTVTSIAEAVFIYCSGLLSIEIPNSVTFIGENAFYGCSNVEQITVGSGNLVFDSRDNCNALIETCSNTLVTGCKNTIIPNSVTSIGYGAFGYCSSLISIDIPNSVTSIENYAFYNCNSLASITVLSDTPPELGNCTFCDVNMDIPVYVPCESADAYINQQWGGFNNIVGMCSYEISATASPAGGGTISGAGIYYVGAECTLTASVNEGYRFINWTENGEVVSSEVTYTFIVTGNRNLVANFIPPVIAAMANPEEGGFVTGTGEVLPGVECSLTASANEGYSFTNWTENGEIVSTNPEYAFIVTGDRNLVANFSYSNSIIAEGTLNGHFSIDPHHQVNFSQGNLQYIGSAGNGDENNTGAYWKFAEHQWDYFGDNDQSSDLRTANRDLFGWGTSGYDHGAVCYQPWSTSRTNGEYLAYGCDTCNLYDNSGQADWGYNAIINGGNQENSGWHTLTHSEWQYLLNTRITVSGMRYTNARVNGILGLILLPDDWDTSYFALSDLDWNNNENNVITASQWNVLEQHGAVFMPNAGWRYKTFYREGFGYWSATCGTSVGSAYACEAVGYYQTSSSGGFSVRLACPAQSYSFVIQVTSDPMEGGTLSGGGVYEGDTECTLVATANTGYTFVNWTENGEVVSTDSTYSFTVTGGRSLVANFRYANANITDGALPGLFSIGEGKQVYFSQGNLQYIGSAETPQWKFAEHQWDIFGDNGQGSDDRKANRDLFCWGTSGYEHGATGCQPWSVYESYYYAYGQGTANLFDCTGKADWGYNAIANGGNQENGGWRTPTHVEWDYLINTRSTSSGVIYAKATVNNVFGLILLPDDWDTTYYELNETNQSEAGFDSNIISATQWGQLEQHGAVFLPVAGHFTYGNYSLSFNYSDDSSYGQYWSSESVNASTAWQMGFSNGPGDGLFISGAWKFQGNSVRLIRSNVTFNINAASNSAEFGVTDGSGPYYEDTKATVTALANEGYSFLNWTENGEVVSTDVAYSFTVDGDKNLVANFIPLGVAPTGTINGIFSVGNGQQVYFSQGNLQYIGSAGNGDENNTGAYWKFAEHQWDVLGDNGQGSDTLLVVDRDLFGWGTSGYDHGAVNYQPWTMATSNYSQNYNAYGCSNCNLSDENGMADWGYNAISNGGNQENSGWHTMTREEWEYVLNNRTTVSEIRYAIAQVNGVNGLILLPDDWRATYFTLNNTNQNSADFSSNIINLEQWSTLEQYGAVFLPAAGVRIGTSVRNIGSELDYWSASSYSNYMAYCIRLYDGYTSITSSYRRRGQSVRLVRSIHTYGINATSNSVESGTVMGTGVYFEGSTCTLTATANEGYTFINWMKGEEEVSTEPEYSFTVTEDADFVANFASDGYHWALPEGYPNTMTVTGVVLVDSVEQHIPSWEIGAFYGDECRGRERLANEQRSNQGRLYFNLVVYGEEDGEEITFRLYDHINEQEMDMECETELPFTSGETYGDPNNLMGLNFIHDATITQTTQFNNGWNWFSTNVEITLDDLKAALVAALPGTNITISSQNSGSTTYNGSNWRGTLNTLDVTQMYKIKTAASCQLELTGEPLNPAEHPITIHNGANWIGFPLNVSMSLNNAFAGFAVSGDIVRSKDGSATYNGSTWRGNLNMLVPGQGYIYKSSVQDNRTFTFGTNK